MADLIEIATGLWARPEQVLAVRTTRGATSGTLTLKPSVTVHIAGLSEIGWEFDDVQNATAWAAKIAGAVNAALQGPAKAIT